MLELLQKVLPLNLLLLKPIQKARESYRTFEMFFESKFKKFGKIPESTKKYRNLRKAFVIFLKVQNSLRKFQNVQESFRNFSDFSKKLKKGSVHSSKWKSHIFDSCQFPYLQHHSYRPITTIVHDERFGVTSTYKPFVCGV